MKLCVFGAGAIGGHLAARLAAAGHDVSLVARGANLAGIRERGLSLHSGAEVVHGPVRAGDRTDGMGVQDAVFVTTKATALGAFAEIAAPLLGSETRVVFVQNGIPWWYARGLAANRPAPPDLSRLDPGGRLAGAVAPQQVIGGIVYSSNGVVAPDDRAAAVWDKLLVNFGSSLCVPLAFARGAGVETPLLDMLAAITARMATAKGLYSPLSSRPYSSQSLN